MTLLKVALSSHRSQCKPESCLLIASTPRAKNSCVSAQSRPPFSRPLEYGCVGYSEEDAREKYGDKLEVYHTNFQPLEWTVPHLEVNACYMKLLVNREDDKVVGFHVLSPNAGEITQGVAVAIRAGATKRVFDSTIGIHPTIAEDMTNLHITKSSGKEFQKSGC